MIHRGAIAATVLCCSLLLVGCNKKDDNSINPNEIIQHIASVNFDKYIEKYGQQSLKEVTEDTELNEQEKVLYDFLIRLNRKDYNDAMKLSNYYNQPFVTEEDFRNGLFSNNDVSYNYSSIVSKDLNKGLKISVTSIPETKDIMVSCILIEDKYEYNGALVKIGDEWKVAISGLSDCLFEIPTGNKLIIDGNEIDTSYIIGNSDKNDLYRLMFLSNTSHTTTGKCVDYAPSGNLGNSKDTMDFQLICTDEEIEEFIKWELEFYTNLYKDAYADTNLTEYFTNDDVIQSVRRAIAEQKSKNISNIEITDLYPTKHLDSPFKKIDNDTIEANVTITISYTYIDSAGKLHTRDGVTDTRVSAIFKKDNGNWKIDKILSKDPILTNSKF